MPVSELGEFECTFYSGNGYPMIDVGIVSNVFKIIEIHKTVFYYLRIDHQYCWVEKKTNPHLGGNVKDGCFRFCSVGNQE